MAEPPVAKVRFSKDELSSVDDEAGRRGLTRSELIRHLVLASINGRSTQPPTPANVGSVAPPPLDKDSRIAKARDYVEDRLAEVSGEDWDEILTSALREASERFQVGRWEIRGPPELGRFIAFRGRDLPMQDSPPRIVWPTPGGSSKNPGSP